MGDKSYLGIRLSLQKLAPGGFLGRRIIKDDLFVIQGIPFDL